MNRILANAPQTRRGPKAVTRDAGNASCKLASKVAKFGRQARRVRSLGLAVCRGISGGGVLVYKPAWNGGFLFDDELRLRTIRSCGRRIGQDLGAGGLSQLLAADVHDLLGRVPTLGGCPTAAGLPSGESRCGHGDFGAFTLAHPPAVAGAGRRGSPRRCSRCIQ